MTTEKQIAANRRNARKSTGPKSAAGKAASGRNALKHGVLSRQAIAAHEDREAYEALLGQIVEEFGPETALECALVERLSILIWREKRLAQAEAELVRRNYELAQEFTAIGEMESVPLQDQYLIGRYQGMLGRQIRDTLKDLRAERDQRDNTIEGAARDSGPKTT